MANRRQLVRLGGAAALAMGAPALLAANRRPWRVLHVMSFHTPWRWTEGQLQGFQEAFDAPMELKVYELDAKQQSSLEAKKRRAAEAIALVESWKPDLLYTTDDDVQPLVSARYVGSSLPIVFSGVNADPGAYGFRGAPNVAGVLEQEHFGESLRLLRSIVPAARRIAVVYDDAEMWAPVIARMRAVAAARQDVEVVAWDRILTWEEYKQKMAGYRSTADAVALVGIFNFKGADGRNVPYQDVLRWTAEHSKLPDLSFWIDRVKHGTLASVTVSEREQGMAAGRLARAILVDGRAPSSLPMQPTLKGLPVVSLARANQLGLKLRSSVLLSSEVVNRYEWDVAAK